VSRRHPIQGGGEITRIAEWRFFIFPYNRDNMNKKLEEKLKTLPREPGVYFHKDKHGKIIYVGKAAVLKNRVRQYFQKNRPHDLKTEALVAEIVDTDWTTVETEIDALFLESEMIKRYKPRFNVLLRDDKSQLFVRIDMQHAYPHVSFTRWPQDDGADYYGPYYNGWAVRKALRFLRRAFPYSVHEVLPKRVCLQYHLGLCPGVEEQKISSADYKITLRKLIRYLKGERKALVRDIEHEMKIAAAHKNFELAAKKRNQLRDLQELQRQVLFSDREFLDMSKDQALVDLKELLGLKKLPYRIEGYDISHMSGTNNVASMVVATNGLADKAEYRKFKMQIPGNNDFAHMHEVISRRFSGKHKDWPKPDLLLIDGGKGQLQSALKALQEKGVSIPAVGLAKRLEEIIIAKDSLVEPALVGGADHSGNGSEKAIAMQGSSGKIYKLTVGTNEVMVIENEDFYVLRIPHDSHIIKLVQRIRDESHRFAVSYHTTLKRGGATKSVLDEIPGVGPATRKKLVMTFGSVRGVKEATHEQLVAALGEKKAALISAWLKK
jgi:excinuclease ABC subunit C